MQRRVLRSFRVSDVEALKRARRFLILSSLRAGLESGLRGTIRQGSYETTIPVMGDVVGTVRCERVDWPLLTLTPSYDCPRNAVQGKALIERGYPAVAAGYPPVYLLPAVILVTESRPAWDAP